MSVLEIIGAIALVDAVISFAAGFVKAWRDDPDPLTGDEIRTGLLYLPWYIWQHRPWRQTIQPRPKGGK